MLNSICEGKISAIEFFTLKLSLRIQPAFMNYKECTSLSKIQESRNLEGKKVPSLFLLISNCNIFLIYEFRQQTTLVLAVPMMWTEIIDYLDITL